MVEASWAEKAGGGFQAQGAACSEPLPGGLGGVGHGRWM